MLSEKLLVRGSELQNFLLVEDIDDYHVCSHLLKNHRISEKYINIIDKKGIDNLLETLDVEAQLHTWLAWQEQPGTPLGLAITNRYFDANAPHAQQLIAWVRRLFSLEQHGT